MAIYNRRCILLKKDPEMAPSTVAETKDLIAHMRKVASCIKSHYYKPSDDEYDRFSVNLFKLAADIETFIKRKNAEE